MNRYFSQFKATREVGAYIGGGEFCYQNDGSITGGVGSYKRDFMVLYYFPHD